MGQTRSRYVESGDVLHVDKDHVSTSHAETEESRARRDDMHAKNRITNDILDSQRLPDSAAAALTPNRGKAERRPWFFANMTEEHWERLNMMCIVSPSSS